VNTLNEIAKQTKTDKSSLHHNFASFYDDNLKHLRDEKIKLIEIGVKKGASVIMWREYFKNGEIHGADIQPKLANVSGYDIHIHKVDQNDRDGLKKLFETYGPFDIIIDDGSHKMSHQQNTLNIGLQYLKKNGIFIMEDLHTSYASYKKTHHDIVETTLNVLKSSIYNDYNIKFFEHPTPNMVNHMSITSIIKYK